MTSQRIAVIGVGNMGSRMAARLIGAGHDITVVDTSPANVQAMTDQGASAASTVAEASATAEVILTSLPTVNAFTSVMTEIADAATARTLVLDTSTVDPATTRNAADRFAASGIQFLDAPVSGGTAGAETGNLVMMIGGAEDVLNSARPVIDELAGRVVHCGPAGAGQLTKLSHNLLTAMNTVALGEVLTAAVAAGANLDVLTDVLGAGLAGSKMLDYLPRTLFTEGRPANFALNLMKKDIDLALTEFASRPMFLGQMTRQLYNTAVCQGRGMADSTGVAEVYEQLNAVRLTL